MSYSETKMPIIIYKYIIMLHLTNFYKLPVFQLSMYIIPSSLSYYMNALNILMLQVAVVRTDVLLWRIEWGSYKKSLQLIRYSLLRSLWKWEYWSKKTWSDLSSQHNSKRWSPDLPGLRSLCFPLYYTMYSILIWYTH
jgi:hypothetical protein